MKGKARLWGENKEFLVDKFGFQDGFGVKAGVETADQRSCCIDYRSEGGDDKARRSDYCVGPGKYCRKGNACRAAQGLGGVSGDCE
ncbi:hypothetical protein AGMMS50249_6780 [candidate division SR1 bacterium]|nr:hypothetical protein AGMMS50249_6780 [candidate division SR1 bacterium]